MRNSDFGMDLRCLTFTPFFKNRALSQSSLFSGGFSSGKTFPESKSSTNSFLRFPGLAAAVWDQKKLAKQRGRHTNVGQLHVILWEWISMKYWSSMWLCKGQQMMQLHDYLTISKKKGGGGRNETPPPVPLKSWSIGPLDKSSQIPFILHQRCHTKRAESKPTRRFEITSNGWSDLGLKVPGHRKHPRNIENKRNIYDSMVFGGGFPIFLLAFLILSLFRKGSWLNFVSCHTFLVVNGKFPLRNLRQASRASLDAFHVQRPGSPYRGSAWCAWNVKRWAWEVVIFSVSTQNGVTVRNTQAFGNYKQIYQQILDFFTEYTFTIYRNGDVYWTIWCDFLQVCESKDA